MKIRILYKLFFSILAGIVISSCVDKPVYPSEPVIVYKDFLRYGNPSNPDSVEVVVSFTDNEGDIGLYQSDTNGVFGYKDSLKSGNFWMTYYYWDTTGVDHWFPYDLDSSTIPIDTLFIPYRVPPVLPEGDPDEPVKGLIYVKQKRISGTFPIFPDKKIKFVIHMYDLAKHKSNVVETPEFDF